MNAKLGCMNDDFERTIWERMVYRPGINKNGVRFVSFCPAKDLVIGGTLFAPGTT